MCNEHTLFFRTIPCNYNDDDDRSLFSLSVYSPTSTALFFLLYFCSDDSALPLFAIYPLVYCRFFLPFSFPVLITQMSDIVID